MTAIAAVLAMSSTAAFAQSVDTPAAVVDTAPAPTPDPLAPDVSATPPEAEPLVSETTAVPAPKAKPAVRASKPATRTTTSRTTTVTRTRAAAPVAATAAPVAQVPATPVVIRPEMAAPAPAPVAAPADPALTEAPVAIDHMTMDEALPYAGAAGLGLLGLLGAGMVTRSRRRRREDALEEAKREQITAAPEDDFAAEPMPLAEIEPAPTFVRPEPVVAAPAAATASHLPEGFDTSRFGRHVQAAYAGPSPENPSASLKRRLTVGHFLDQKEAAEAQAEPARASKPATKQTWAARADSDFMFRRQGTQPSLKPAYQK